MPDFIIPDWPAPAHVKALQTQRGGGVSQEPYASLNLGDHVGDDPAAVAENRQRVTAALPGPGLWLQQVHGTRVVDAAVATCGEAADAAFSRSAGVVCTVMTADCLPVLFCDQAGTVVAAAHAGWRGLCDGILEQTLSRMGVPPESVMAWLGPAIGPGAFEVGGEVRAAFMARAPEAVSAFVAGQGGKWLADIYLLARQRLLATGVTAIYGGTYCAVSQSERFFSYRRDGVTGRMASLIWLDAL